MPEGDRDFRHWRDNIAEIVSGLEVPVVVKEVGAGLSGETVALLRDSGVAAVDVAGRGGTDFAAIESARWAHGERAYLAGWGQSAVCSLLDVGQIGGVGATAETAEVDLDSPAAGESGRSSVVLLASGGVRHPLDVVRALALGAQSVGAAGTFLRAVTESGPEGLIELVSGWLVELRDLMALLGARSIADLRRTDLLLTGPVREYAELRGVPVAHYARRASWTREQVTPASFA